MALQHLQSGEQCRDPELRLRARASEIQQLAMGIRQQKGEPALVSAS
jgi:hypothetical protein